MTTHFHNSCEGLACGLAITVMPSAAVVPDTVKCVVIGDGAVGKVPHDIFTFRPAC